MNMALATVAAVGLIIFVAFVATRLVKARASGLSIRMQVFLALGLIVGAFAFGLGIIVLDRVKARADFVGQDAARDEANMVSSLIASEIALGNRPLGDVADRLLSGPAASRPKHLVLLDPQGKRVFPRNPPTVESLTVFADAPIVVGGKTLGSVRVFKPTVEIRQTLADFAPTVLVISLLLGTVAAAAAALIGGTIATPIEDLTQYAERVSNGDRRAPPPLGQGREVRRLTRSLDSMRRQLEGGAFVETFAADLSHELKNPVAAIRASAEVLRDGAISDAEEGPRFVGRILESSSRIESLLSELLSLARLEARGVEDEARFDLSECAHEVAAEVEAVTIEPHATRHWDVRGDRAWVTRALANLIQNAQLHGEKDQPIKVELSHEDDRLLCRVHSRGSIDAELKRRIFRRFVTTRADRGGTGLGLAIVRAVAEAHGGDVRCMDAGPPTVTFELALPEAPMALSLGLPSHKSLKS